MKIRLVVKDEGIDPVTNKTHPSWVEELRDCPDVTSNESAEAKGREIIAAFNASRRDSEPAREFVSAEVILDKPTRTEEITEFAQLLTREELFHFLNQVDADDIDEWAKEEGLELGDVEKGL